MRRATWMMWLAAMAVVVSAPTANAQAPVEFADIDDAVASRFFDPATSTTVGNRLVIGFNSGRDAATRKIRTFRASTTANSYTTAMDTISFTVNAPSGFYVSKITYRQKGSGSVIRTGKTAGAANWVVGDFSYDLGTFGLNPTLTRSLDLRHLRWRTVPVSITASLFAYSTGQSGSATISITGAEVLVEVLPL
jgi:hypothetical protein